MDKFEIEMLPLIPEPNEVLSEFPDLNPRWQEINTKIPQQYQIIYHVNEEKFAYYPTDAVAVYNDLLEEIEQFNNEASHYVALVGYNVAYALCISGKVWFANPPRYGEEDQVKVEGDGLHLGMVIKTFERTASALLQHITKILP